MTKKELLIICKQLVLTVEKLEKRIERGLKDDPNYQYLEKISAAFNGCREIDKSSITRETIIKAMGKRSNNRRNW